MAAYDLIAVYIMASQPNGTIYIGVTSDLLNRALQHRERRIDGFTRKYGCTLLVWWEQHHDINEAIAREKQLKAWRRAWKLALIEKSNPTWRDLYEDFLLPPNRIRVESMIPDIPAFIRENTRLLAPSHVPELKLYLADDAVALWELTEEQLGELGLPPPFWAFAWAGGQALARYVLDHPEIARGKDVLDVASGCGIVAIAAMKAGAHSACAVDIDAFAGEAALLNAALNDVRLTASSAAPIGKATDADLILVGDLFYDRDLAPPLLEWLLSLQSEGKGVLIGDPGRTYLPKARLEKLAEYAIPVTRALEDAEVKRTGVWRIAS